MRGKVRRNFPTKGDIGITPAYAGKSAVDQSLNALCQGSPPPMRGKVESGYLNDDGTGITPAYAGKRPAIIQKNNMKQDHPRLCGEKLPLLHHLHR